METLASILRRSVAFTKVDATLAGVGTAAPFLVGAAAPPGADLHTVVNMLLVAAVTGAATAVVKGSLAGVGAFLRAKVRRWRGDKDPANDDAADAVEAVANAIDPKGKPEAAASSGAPETSNNRGPQP